MAWTPKAKPFNNTEKVRIISLSTTCSVASREMEAIKWSYSAIQIATIVKCEVAIGNSPANEIINSITVIGKQGKAIIDSQLFSEDKKTTAIIEEALKQMREAYAIAKKSVSK